MTRRKLREPLKWKRKPFPELVRLAWPIGVSMLSYSLMTLVDTLFVGRLGATALSGVSVGGVAFFTLLCFGFGLLRSVKVAVSQAVGAGESERTAGYVGAGLILALGIGVANIVVGLSASDLIGSVSASADGARAASEYLDVRVLSAPFALVAIALREARYGNGDAQTPMRITVLVNVVNIALDYLLIVHFNYGIAGAAWATVAATAIDAVLLAWAQRRDGLPFGLDERALAEVRPLWRLGVPLGLQMLLEVGAFALLTGIFASMSEIDVAAHQIALQVAHFSFLPAFALGEAASVLAGQAVGAKSYRLVKVVARKTLWVAAIYTGFCGLVFAALPRVIAGAFTDDALLIDTTVKLLYVAAIFQIFDGANIVARSILRGTGDVRFPALVSVTVVWITTPPLAIALGYGLGMGVLGGWIGLCVEIIVGALILWRRLETNGWLDAARRSQRELDGVDSGLQPAPAA